jgi:capsular exopolysaccharide synthesis family protein
MNIDNPPRVIVITSSLPGEGKSVIAMNLASSLAASGTRVVLVDADLRRPTLIHKLGLVDGAGLTDVLVGRAKRADVLQSVGRTGNLQVMGPGSLPPNPSELLGSDTMQNLLNELSQVAMVIIDAPPLLPVTDAVILTARTDGAIVVARAGETKTDQLSSALEHISRIGGKSLGLVLNSIPLRGLSGQDYGYQYQGYYKVKDTPKFAKQKPNRAS